MARRRRGARAEAEEASMRRRRRRPIRRRRRCHRPLPPPLPLSRPPTSTSCSSTTRGCSGWSWRACCASAATKVRKTWEKNERMNSTFSQGLFVSLGLVGLKKKRGRTNNVEVARSHSRPLFNTHKKLFLQSPTSSPASRPSTSSAPTPRGPSTSSSPTS